MNLLYMVLGKEFVRIACLIGEVADIKQVEKNNLIAELKDRMAPLAESDFPIEMVFKGEEVTSFMGSEMMALTHQNSDFLVLDDQPSEWHLLCGAAGMLTTIVGYYLRWDDRGVTCIRLKEGQIEETKQFLVPLSEKKIIKQLKVAELQRSIMLFYGRPVGIVDLVKFEQVGDPVASQFLQEIANCLLEILAELTKSSSETTYYVSRIFPLCKEKVFMAAFKQMAWETLGIRIH